MPDQVSSLRLQIGGDSFEEKQKSTRAHHGFYSIAVELINAGG